MLFSECDEGLAQMFSKVRVHGRLKRSKPLLGLCIARFNTDVIRVVGKLAHADSDTFLVVPDNDLMLG